VSRFTVAAPATVEGIGLHLGQPCRLSFCPAASGAGIVIQRTDIEGAPAIPARLAQVTASERRTQLGRGVNTVHTVEHVLAAVAASGIDDLIITMDGPEPPIVDGSAAPFFAALQRVGLADIGGEADYLVIAEPVRIIDGESIYDAQPASGLELDVTIEFPHPKIARQTMRLEITRDTFSTELSGARTFGFLSEVESLRGKGLIQGASLENAIVLDDDNVVNGPLRWRDEFVRHKMMDCVGDLALAGARVHAKITVTRPSHRGTVTLLRELMRTGTLQSGGAGLRNRQKSGRGDMVYAIEDIMKVLAHRYPFLLVDRILEIEHNKRIVGLKNVTINEPFFQGHFPGHPIMPGVLIIEAMAQVGGMLLMGSLDDLDAKVVYFMSLDNVKFRKPVKPGDQIIFELEIVQVRGKVCKMRGVGKVDGEVVAEADMAAMVRDR